MGPDMSRIVSGNHKRVPSLFFMFSPGEGSLGKTQLSCQFVSPLSKSAIPVAVRAKLDKSALEVSLPFSCDQSLACGPCTSNITASSVRRLCSTVSLFSLSALGPTALARKVFLAERNINFDCSSCPPMMQ